MALPHLKPSIYATRRNIYEAAILHRRNHEQDFRERWSKTANYFSNTNVAATKQAEWGSDKSFYSSMQAWQAQHEKESKALNLQTRKRKLADLLKKENALYEEELTDLIRGGSRLDYMKDRSETLRSAREEERKRLAEEKLYDHWRHNNHDLRKLEVDQHKEHVIKSWQEQHEEKLLQEQKEKEEQERIEQEMERERQEALRAERRRQEEQLKEEKSLKSILKKQMMELKAREAEAAQLKREQEQLMMRQWQVEDLEGERKKMEAERKKQEFGRFLLRQHTAALRRKSKEVQKELAEDRLLLEKLAQQEEENYTLQTERREKAQTDAKWMKQVIEDQIKLEKAREAELDMLYQEEAARLWEQREAEWARERKARERLMKEVLNDRSKQIADRMESVRKQQEESLERREELLREIEIANQMTRREVKEQEVAKTQRQRELRAQITSRREAERLNKRLEEDELLEEEKMEKDYEEMLKREAEMLKIQGFQPKDHSRKQAWL